MRNWIIAIGLTLAPAFGTAALPAPVKVLAAEWRALGSGDDAGFAHAFFSIWLDRRTRSPELRAQLLGEP